MLCLTATKVTFFSINRICNLSRFPYCYHQFGTKVQKKSEEIQNKKKSAAVWQSLSLPLRRRIKIKNLHDWIT